MLSPLQGRDAELVEVGYSLALDNLSSHLKIPFFYSYKFVVTHL